LTLTDLYTPGSYINAISEHHYQGSGKLNDRSTWPAIASGLITKTSVRTNIARFNDAVVGAKARNISFVIGETNTYSGHGQEGVSNSAAAALWVVDYSLQAAAIGVSTVFYHQGIGYNYSGRSIYGLVLEVE
jgi:hypothetical protein